MLESCSSVGRHAAELKPETGRTNDATGMAARDRDSVSLAGIA